MMNWIFIALVVVAAIAGAHLGTMKDVTAASANSAKGAVEIAISLIGQMALWLGLMRILEEAGLLRTLARWMKPIMTRLFPDVPPEHPAMSAMILNIAANMAGLNNAATPFGLRAMQELNKLNTKKGVATNAMVLFLAINTAGVAVLPTTVIALRASLGAKNLTGIVAPTLLATILSTLTAIIVAKVLERVAFFGADRYASSGEGGGSSDAPAVKGIEAAEAAANIEPLRMTPLRSVFIVGIAIAIGWGFVKNQLAVDGGPSLWPVVRELLEGWLLPLMILAIVLFGFGRQVKVYESLVQGAKEGFNVAVMIIPYMVAILVAIGMFRASGAMDIMVRGLAPITTPFGFPPEALPMAIIRPLSGSGGLATLTDTMKAHGTDSFIGFLTSVINGSVETTFYVIAVYFGSVHVRATRQTLIPCLAADFAGLVGALVFSRMFY